MKKTKKKEALESILNQEELSMLKGGIRNVNQTTDCNCDYNNSTGLTNKNTADSCSCTCTGIEKPGLET
ncbi:MAG: hypothetical protein AB7E36_01220 [Salinivirgaceae bacterium]